MFEQFDGPTAIVLALITAFPPTLASILALMTSLTNRRKMQEAIVPLVQTAPKIDEISDISNRVKSIEEKLSNLSFPLKS